ncbi:MAG: hypothetical protein M1837_000841 [Sclerophora amabilis]|nr:MAG: hypothetical protein M1837_000841 [Sclerophora amabilis]
MSVDSAIWDSGRETLYNFGIKLINKPKPEPEPEDVEDGPKCTESKSKEKCKREASWPQGSSGSRYGGKDRGHKHSRRSTQTKSYCLPNPDCSNHEGFEYRRKGEPPADPAPLFADGKDLWGIDKVDPKNVPLLRDPTQVMPTDHYEGNPDLSYVGINPDTEEECVPLPPFEFTPGDTDLKRVFLFSAQLRSIQINPQRGASGNILATAVRGGSAGDGNDQIEKVRLSPKVPS